MHIDKKINACFEQALEDTIQDEKLNKFLYKYYQLSLSGEFKGGDLADFREGALKLTNSNPKKYPKSVAALITIVYQKEVTSGYGLRLF